MFKFGPTAVALLLLAGLMPTVSTAGIQIGSGNLSLGGGVIDFGCAGLVIDDNGRLDAQRGQLIQMGSLVNAGELQAAQAMIAVSGAWTTTGNFLAGQSIVEITNDCANSTAINGANTFWRLQADGVGQELLFGAGQTQQVLNGLVLRGGSAAERLFIRSSTPGQPAFIDLALDATQDIFWVDVANNLATASGQALAIGSPEAVESVDSGGNRNWFTDGLLPALPVPALAPLPVTLLTLLLLVIGLLQQRRCSLAHSS